MNSEYRKRFLSVETGPQLTRRMFLEGDDVMKSEVFGCNTSQWKPIRDKVETWVQDNWSRWEEEKPEFFTDLWKAGVPLGMLPKKKVEESSGENGDFAKKKKSRKESIIDNITISAIASLGRIQIKERFKIKDF